MQEASSSWLEKQPLVKVGLTSLMAQMSTGGGGEQDVSVGCLANPNLKPSLTMNFTCGVIYYYIFLFYCYIFLITE